jgi:hypothetical protein
LKTIFKYAMAVSATAIIFKLAIFLGGYNHQWPDNNYLYIVFLLLLLGIFLGMHEIAAKMGGNISIVQLIKEGCKISGINAITMSGFIYLYYKLIDTKYFTTKINSTMQLLSEKGAGKEELIEYYLNSKYIFFAPDKVASMALFGYMAMGCLYSILCGIILRRRLLGRPGATMA